MSVAGSATGTTRAVSMSKYTRSVRLDASIVIASSGTGGPPPSSVYASVGGPASASMPASTCMTLVGADTGAQRKRRTPGLPAVS